MSPKMTKNSLIRLTRTSMSKPVPSGTIAGKSDRFGLSGAVIVSGCLDQVAAAVGAGVVLVDVDFLHSVAVLSRIA